MKKLMLLILLLAVVGTVRANLVANPGFEGGPWVDETTNPPDQWWTYSYSPLWKNDSTLAHTGDKCMELWGYYANGYTSTAEVGQDIVVTPGQIIAFSVWARSDGGADLTFDARFRDGGDWLEWPSVTVTTTSDWAKYYLGTYQAPLLTDDVQIVLRNTGGPLGSAARAGQARGEEYWAVRPPCGAGRADPHRAAVRPRGDRRAGPPAERSGGVRRFEAVVRDRRCGDGGDRGFCGW